MKTDEPKPDYTAESQEALEMLGKGYEPAAIIEQPHQRIVLRDGLNQEWTVAWVKLSTAFKPHIKELKGAPLAVWLYLSLSINPQGVAFPGIRTMAEEIGYSHQGILDAITTLEEKGYLKVRRGEHRFNLYEPEFAAIGRTNEPSETVKLVESTELTGQVLPPNESTFSPNESTPLDLNKKNKNNKSLDILDGILDYQLKPQSIREAFAKFFKLTPNWEAKYNRQFLEWMVQANVTAEQIQRAAKVWGSDKRFNWSHPNLKGIQEHWYQLIENVVADFEGEKVRLL